ncbi:MAG: EVE domain-containing protein [Elusimicrobia bacterium]|nr:EVE domain-containing protein [Elusimicrobiota bacterium]MDE2236316.1 EVE domain-containing protein [Elusimicrobiota bacterium]MDE2425280.1 EVE domain-containing protein [Elusimicrobiota bacterium]
MAFWLMKSEPGAFSIDDLAARPGRRTGWDGVRNYQARNFMRAMRVGDRAFFYHSNAEPSGIAGLVEIVRRAYPDPTQFDSRDSHYDERATPERPVWEQVDVRLLQKFPRLLPLAELRGMPELKGMALFTRGRLSVQPVAPPQYSAILKKSRPSCGRPQAG